jgi:hypothetical protein
VGNLLGRLRVVLLIVGAVVTVVGVLGLAFGWGSTSTMRVEGSGTASSRLETPGAFFASFTAAVRSGDRSFLFDRLHPAVIARYGAAQCQVFVAELVDPTASLRLVDVAGPASYDYASDGRSTRVPRTYTFTSQGTAAGRSGTHIYHLAVVDGRFRTFADCGDPVAGS